ncbi:hypothetical protein DHEL01_v209670 [Diaporthe helianthi]|uniref:Uncharacterized protein n=1 Tax=Diaporthe helianthi TaxID=158607 RepID=A0A2P5HNV5_DIAHE|nr:hypothetical protein DHEL01_v209670 [Diaporthe helianthi]
MGVSSFPLFGELWMMTGVPPKRGRGRPKGSGKAGAPRAPSESDNDDGAWEVERQILLDENQDLKNRCAELKAALALNLEKSTAQLQRAGEVINDNEREIEELQNSLHASQDRIDKLMVDKMACLRRATEAEEREAQLQERIDNQQSGQPGPSTAGASASASASAGAPRRDRSSSVEEVPSQGQARVGAAVSAPPPPPPPQRQRRTGRQPWPPADELLLVSLIARLDTPRGGKPRFSDIARIWKEQFPDRIPRNEEQLKDKAWNIKATALM